MIPVIHRNPQNKSLPPGTPQYLAEKKVERVTVEVIEYGPERCHTHMTDSLDGVFPDRNAPGVTWINICGLHDEAIVRAVGERFDVHPIVLEDIVHLGQRPKIEMGDGYIHMVMRMISLAADGILREQVSFILGRNYLISFQEKPGDVFGPVRERIETGLGRIRKMTADYLAYSLFDAVIDNYFTVLENMEDRISSLENEVMAQGARDVVIKINRLKSEMITLRKSVWPLREVLNNMQKSESPLVRPASRIYYRDAYDHTIQVIDTLESLRDVLGGFFDLYLTQLSARSNEVMKVLTIIATIFIPLTFIAGVYGMNFKVMPELNWPYGYPLVLAIMAAAAGGMLLYFKIKKWL